ncbi:MAG: glycosyltransferase [Chloroflexota bacterium]
MSDDERIAGLEATIARLERDLAESKELRREAVAARDAVSARLDRARERLDTLRGRRAVRVALVASDRSHWAVDAVEKFIARPRQVAGSIRRRIRGSGGRRGAVSEQAKRGMGTAISREADLDDSGPGAYRDALLDAIDDALRSSDTRFHVAIVGGGATAEELGVGPETLGWRVSQVGPADARAAIDPSVEAVIVFDAASDIRELPRRLISIASIADPAPWLDAPWFDDLDIVLGASPSVVEAVRLGSAKTATLAPAPIDAVVVRDAIVAWATATRYGLRVGVPDRAVADRWGDYHFARALQRALERAGHPTRLHLLPDWASGVAAREDVTVHLLGLKDAPIRPDQVNLLWQISHPDVATPELYERYDHVFVASDPFAARMATLAKVPVTALHQATDPERFRPDPTGPEHELLFVGNSRNVRRRIVDDAVATGHDLAVYGGRWRPDLIDPRFLKGEQIPNDELRRYYSSAAIVLSDHWHDMRAEGFISNRLYDALACGAFVISDHIEGLQAEFDDAVVTYQDRDELRTLVERYLADPAERRRRGELGRAAVLARHTFEARAGVIRATADSILAARRAQPPALMRTGRAAPPR